MPKINNYRFMRLVVAGLIAGLVSAAISADQGWLAVASAAAGSLFLFLVRSKTKVLVDEREKTMREKASLLTYSICTPIFGLLGFICTALFQHSPQIFMIGQVLAYVALLQIAVYANCFAWIGKRLGGKTDEK